MPKLSRIPTQDFDRDVTAVAMDDRFILIGQVDGLLSAVYQKNGIKVFSIKISNAEITAVCCEEQDEDSNQIFYAPDSSNIIISKLRPIQYSSTLDNWHNNLLTRNT